MLLGMTTTEDDLADIVDAIANLDETSSYANAVQDMLHVLSSNDEFTGERINIYVFCGNNNNIW